MNEIKKENKESLVVISWDGIAEPCKYILKDCDKVFSLLIFDYSGLANLNKIENIDFDHFVSIKSECKGDILKYTHQYLIENNLIHNFNYIGLFDDDILVTISDINKALFIANVENLDVFQFSLSHDSYYNHKQFLNKHGFNIINTMWVEIMAPFYKIEIYNDASKYFSESISGTGIDVYLIPTVQKILNKNNTAVIHSVIMKHSRPIRTDGRIFSNGLNNLQEIKKIQEISKLIYFQNIVCRDFKFEKNILNKRYIYGIPLKYKIQRIPLMLKNIYKLFVNESYR